MPPSASSEKRTKAGVSGPARKRNLTTSKLYMNLAIAQGTDSISEDALQEVIVGGR